MVDIMDENKRCLAKSYPEKALFIPAATISQIAVFEQQKGEFWEESLGEEIVLQLTDIKGRQRDRVQAKMNDYYSRKQNNNKKLTQRILAMLQNLRDSTSMFFGRHLWLSDEEELGLSLTTWVPFLPDAGATKQRVYSIDQAHPTEVGYDLWGRLIGKAIVQKWKQQHSQHCQ